MSILAKSPDLKKIIEKAVARIGESHGLTRDNKGVEFKASEIEEDRKEFRKSRLKEGKEEMAQVIEESLKAVAEEMAQKLVLENTIDGMIKETLQGQTSIGNKLKSVGSGFDDEQGSSNTLETFKKRQEMGEQNEEVVETEDAEQEGEVDDSEKESKLDEATKSIIKKLVNKKLKEATNVHPGFDTYTKAVKKSKTENDKAMKDTKKKFKEYENFEGNEDPQFPHQEMSKTNADGQFQYYRNTEEDQEFVDDFAHPGLLDFDANNLDMERLTKYLDGSRETGNAQTDDDGEALGNVVPSDLGKKMLKSKERRAEKVAKQKASMTNLRGYTPDVQKVHQVKESVEKDIDLMKNLWSYGKKTQ